MWRISLGLLVLLLGCGLAEAQSTVRPCVSGPNGSCPPVSASNPLPVTTDATGSLPVSMGTGGQYILSAGNNSAVVTLTVPAGATQALMDVETANVRFTVDGTTPSATVGHLLAPGQYKTFFFPGTVKLFGAASATVNVDYYQ